MSKLPALISVIAQYDPRGKNAVENLSRELKKANLITTGKSGVGAPYMTATDVTNMLLGRVTRQSNEAPEAVKMLRDAESEVPWEGKPDPVDELQHFPFFERAKDDDNRVRAGRFVDCLIEDFIEFGGVKDRQGNAPIFDVELHVESPIGGIGQVKVTFLRLMPDEFSITFFGSIRGSKDAIQDGVTINQTVLHAVTDEMRKGRKSK